MNPYQMKKEDVLKMLGTDENGLTQNQAKENQKKYGKNAILKGMNLEDGATARERNRTIGGHQA
mgnify:CR=1 FL=1